MSVIYANGIKVEVEVEGPENGIPVLLVMGLGAQLTYWPVPFMSALHDAGFRTIRFDNRDIGKSEKMHGKRTPNLMLQISSRRLGLRGLAAYSLKDMAKDAVSVLDALGIAKAHIVGVSMGGIISQIIAGKYPKRVLSFTGIMTTTGNRSLPGPSKDVLMKVFKSSDMPLSRDAAIDKALGIWDVIGTKDSGWTDGEVRARVENSFDRSYYPSGTARQVSAIIETGDVRKWTRKIKVPSLIVHGKTDPLVPVSGGKDIAKNIAGSELMLLDDMGHDLPKKYLGPITNAMIAHFRSATEQKSKAA